MPLSNDSPFLQKPYLLLVKKKGLEPLSSSFYITLFGVLLCRLQVTSYLMFVFCFFVFVPFSFSFLVVFAFFCHCHHASLASYVIFSCFEPRCFVAPYCFYFMPCYFALPYCFTLCLVVSFHALLIKHTLLFCFVPCCFVMPCCFTLCLVISSCFVILPCALLLCLALLLHVVPHLACLHAPLCCTTPCYFIS